LLCTYHEILEFGQIFFSGSVLISSKFFFERPHHPMKYGSRSGFFSFL
jgi:hypothetical protein